MPSAAELDERARRQTEQNLSFPPLTVTLAGIIRSISAISPALSEQMILDRSINPAVMRFNGPQSVTPSSDMQRPETPPTPPATDDGMGGLPYYQPDEQPLTQSESGITNASDQSSMDDESSEQTNGDEPTGPDLEIANRSIIQGRPVENTFASILSNPAQSAQEFVEFRWIGKYLMYSLLSDNQLAYLKEQSPANPANFFNFKGIIMTFKEGTTLDRREWICDNTIIAFGKLVMECENHRTPGIVNRVVVVDPQYTAKLAMERGNTRNRGLVNMMAQHKTPSTRQYFLPTNGDKTHWFLIVADIKNGKITGMETFKTNRMGALIKVKKILDDNWDVLGNGPKPVWKLTMKMPPTMPQQKDSVNCGIYTCAFMDLIAAGVTYSALKTLVCNRNIKYIRGRFTRFMDGFNYA